MPDDPTDPLYENCYPGALDPRTVPRKSAYSHSRYLRRVLTEERKRRSLTRQALADLVRAHLDIKKLSGQTIYNWETFVAHPSIDKFSSWARVLGYRLIVDMVPVDLERLPLFLNTDEAIEAAKLIDELNEKDRMKMLQVLRTLTSD